MATVHPHRTEQLVEHTLRENEQVRKEARQESARLRSSSRQASDFARRARVALGRITRRHEHA